MLRIALFAVAVLVAPAIVPATAARLDASCNQAFEAAAARARVQAARRDSADPAQAEESCRAYGIQFFEAVKARYVASFCEDGVDHQRDLAVLDAGIDAVNNLIASQCGGS
jgi:tartrate dehydratase beta subunit/fumarate hydratase class I family protein